MSLIYIYIHKKHVLKLPVLSESQASLKTLQLCKQASDSAHMIMIKCNLVLVITFLEFGIASF